MERPRSLVVTCSRTSSTSIFSIHRQSKGCSDVTGRQLVFSDSEAIPVVAIPPYADGAPWSCTTSQLTVTDCLDAYCIILLWFRSLDRRMSSRLQEHSDTPIPLVPPNVTPARPSGGRPAQGTLKLVPTQQPGKGNEGLGHTGVQRRYMNMYFNCIGTGCGRGCCCKNNGPQPPPAPLLHPW